MDSICGKFGWGIFFFAKKTAAESHRLLVEVYGDHALSNIQCKEWFHRFKSEDFDIKNKERPGQPKKKN